MMGGVSGGGGGGGGGGDPTLSAPSFSGQHRFHGERLPALAEPVVAAWAAQLEGGLARLLLDPQVAAAALRVSEALRVKGGSGGGGFLALSRANHHHHSQSGRDPRLRQWRNDGPVTFESWR